MRMADTGGLRGRRLLYVVAPGCIVIVLLGVAHVRARCDEVYALDGWAGCFLPALYTREDTEYAPGYSHAAFRKLRLGMSDSDVLALLGPPLERYPVKGLDEGWRWTRSPRDRSYRTRVVLFQNGTVSEIRHGFYLD
jgi:hypothetical protein